jgi:LCP family protein required for cell wall assembly
LQLEIAPPTPQGLPIAQSILRGLTLAAVTVGSATLGLMVAMAIPLPTGPATGTENGLQPVQTLWEVGFQYRVGRPVNVLVMGIDRVPDTQTDSDAIFAGRSDTMLVLRVDPGDDSVRLLSIPRDTQVEIPGVGMTKINDANVRGGSPLAAQTVSQVLNGVPIDRYVRVSTDAFRELVDLLGGVEVYVPAPMSYVDNTQKLKIDLSKGVQTLNGDQAEQFARFRQDAYGDIGRVQRQQTLLKALLKRLTSPTVIPRLPGLVSAMQKYVDTNLSVEEMLALAGAGRKLSQGNFKMVMLPGRFSAPGEFAASYWIMDPKARDRVMQQYFDIQPETAIRDSVPATSLRIAIQNASSHPGAASELNRQLINLGFQNTYVIDDWGEQKAQTEIIVQRGDLDNATALQKVLGFGAVAANSTGDIDSDLTLQIGDDWLNQPEQ